MQTGYHMRGCCAEQPGLMKIERDPSNGNVTSMRGISAEMFDWMARSFNLTYECGNVPVLTVENTTNGIGVLHYMTNDICDLGIGPTVALYRRFQVVDFLHPWSTEPANLLIPMPVFISDSSAFVKPFSFPVWMIIMGSILAMISTLILLDSIEVESLNVASPRRTRLDLHWLFVVGSFIGRGGFNESDKIRIRIAMAVWMLGSFILVEMYTTQLFGYLMTSIPVPIVNSAEELADKPNVDLVVVNGWAFDLTIMKSDFPLMKKLAKKLYENPIASRCANVPECIELVKKRKRPTVFIHTIGSLAAVMMEDFRKTGQCNFGLAKKNFDNYHGSWIVRKGDPLTEIYNRGTMRMHAMGLLNHWFDVYQPKPWKCLKMAEPVENPHNPTKISLTNLAILFGMLLAGYVLSFIIFIWEKCCFAFKSR